MKKQLKVAKFAFIGAPSVGKTTLTNFFKKKFADCSNVAVLDEAARIFFNTHPEITDRSFPIQQAIQKLVLKRERAAYKPGIEIIISDRSVIDPIVLTQILDEENVDKLLKNAENWLQTYTLFFILDESGVPSDLVPPRLETQEQRSAIQAASIDFCITHGLNYVLISGSLEERIQEIEILMKTYF